MLDLSRRLPKFLRGVGATSAAQTVPGVGQVRAIARSGSLGLWRRLLRHWRTAWLRLAALVFVALLASPIELLEPLPLKLAVDGVLGSRPLPGFLDAVLPNRLAHSAGSLLLVVAALILLIALMSQLRSLAQAYLSTRAGEQLVAELRAAIFRHVQRLSFSYHDASRSADSVRCIQRDAPATQKILIDVLIPLVSSAATVVALSYVMIRLDWQLAVIALALSVPLILARRFYRSVLSQRRREANDLESTAMAVIAEGLGPLRNVTALGDQEREPQRFLRRAAHAARGRARVKLAEGRFGLILSVLAAVGMAAVVFLGMDHVRASVLSLGNLLVVMAYAAQLQRPMQSISRNTAALRDCLARAKRTFALLDQLPAVTQQATALPIARARGAVSFRGVSVSFDGSHTVLYGVSFEVDPGARLGIAGATGAAKGALISLLTRLCDPTEGRILLDGADLRDYRLDDLRRQFAVVPWEPAFLSGSIAENIAAGARCASREQIVAAARAANAHAWVERLPDGYDTPIGERGLKLSWASRQSLALARAVLSDCPVLILERPTRAVADPMDGALADALERLMQGRTVIAIGGHPSSVAGCSEVLQLQKGRVTGDTTRSRITLSRPPSAQRAGASGDARLDRTRLLAHPAVQAWCRLGPNGPLPTRVVPAKVKTHTSRTINVYRLEDVAPGGGAVIAKKCKPSTGAVERLVYEEYLPRLPVRGAGYLGWVEEPADGKMWIFTRELTGERFVNEERAHRIYAAQWIGALHASAAAIGRRPGLPANDPRRYLEHLRHARELINTHRKNPILMPEDVALLETLLSRLDEVERRWDSLESLCAEAPHTLVHGDFSRKNVLVQSAGGQPGIVVYDWECAGWGPPAVDLAQFALPATSRAANPDLATYWQTARDLWRGGDCAGIERLANCGTVFRILAALDWEAPALEYEWAPWQIPTMRLAEADLTLALRRRRME